MTTSSKRQDILDASLSLLVEHDIQATSMARIAKAAKVGMGTIYNYFESKEVLLEALYRSVRQQLHDLIFNAYPDTGSYRDRFLHIWRAMLRYYIANPKAFLFSERYAASSFLTPEIVQESAEMWTEFNQMLLQAQADKVIKAMPPALFLSLVPGAIRAVATSHIRGRLFLDDDMIETVVTSLWDSVKESAS